MVLTYWSQVLHGKQQWFSKKGVEDAVQIKRDKHQDCALLMANLLERLGAKPGPQYGCLAYSGYSKLPNATGYGHAPTDPMAAIWVAPKQMLRAIAGTYAMPWGAPHDTNWPKLGCFGFATLGPPKVVELAAQGPQRHEGIATARWALRTPKAPLGGATPIRICSIDGDWASRLASRVECPWLGLVLGGWHGDQTYGKDMEGGLGRGPHGSLAKLWAPKYGSDIRAQLDVDAILGGLIQSCGMFPKKVKGVWVAYNRVFEAGENIPCVKFITDLVAEVRMWARCYTHHLGVRGEMNGSGYCESHHAKIKKYLSVATHVSEFLHADYMLTDTQDADRIEPRKNAFFNSSVAYVSGTHTPVCRLVSANHTLVGTFQGAN